MTVEADRLTKRQREIYEFIRHKIQNRGFGPTVREIGKQFKISSPNGVICHLKALEKKGLIKRTAKEARSIELMQESVQKRMSLPLAGSVAAGVMHEAVEQAETLDLRDLLVRDDCFALEVHGDSMIEAHIADGDFVIVHRQPTADRGQMVVAKTDGEATLKYWFPEKGAIRLQPANATMKPIIVSQAEVVGVVVGVVRNLR
jgi:repressor LexA